MSLPDDRAGVYARVPADEQQIRSALRCGRSCACNRPRGKVHCPLHDAGAGGKPDMDVKATGDTVLVTCRVCGSGAQADLIAALQDRDLWPRRQADVISFRSTPSSATRTERRAGTPPLRIVAETRDEIKDGAGVVQAIHVRKDLEGGDKDCIWEQPNGRTGLAGRKVATLPLYGMELLPGLPDGATVVLCEGEKATKAARQLGVHAVGTVCGAGVIPTDDVLSPLVRFDVVRWDDHDAKGHQHMQAITERLVAMDGSVRVLDWPEAQPKDDAADFLARGGTPEQAARMVDEARPYNPLAGLGLVSAAQLQATQFPEPRTVVPSLLCEGVTLLAGRPKLGKSRLALNLAVAVAAGGRALGSLPVERGRVLYLALEDGARRTRTRAREIWDAPPDGLDFGFTWSRLDEGGLDDIDRWCAAYPDARLVVVDTAQRIRPRSTGRQTLYAEDYEFLAPLNDLALKHRVAIVVVHHSRKGESDDPLEMVSGSNGLTGAVDGAIVLKRERGRADATLSVIHRDLGDAEYALRLDPDVGSWTLIGDAAEYRLSSERAAILDAVREAVAPVGPKAVADALGKRYGAIANLMQKMRDSGELASAGYGKYIIGVTGVSGVSDVTGVSGVTPREQGEVTPLTPPDGGAVKLPPGGVTPLTPVTSLDPPVRVSPDWRCPDCGALEHMTTAEGRERCAGCGVVTVDDEVPW